MKSRTSEESGSNPQHQRQLKTRAPLVSPLEHAQIPHGVEARILIGGKRLEQEIMATGNFALLNFKGWPAGTSSKLSQQFRKCKFFYSPSHCLLRRNCWHLAVQVLQLGVTISGDRVGHKRLLNFARSCRDKERPEDFRISMTKIA